MLRITRLAAALTLAAILQGCGGCGGDPGQSVFGVSCSGAAGGKLPSDFAQGVGPGAAVVPSGVDVISVSATSASVRNFAARLDGALIINAVIGPGQAPESFGGTYSTKPGARFEVVTGEGVAWSLSAASADTASSAKLNRSGVGDAVITLPARAARYTTTGRSAASSNFVVRVGGRLVVNEIVGPAGFSGSFSGQAQEQLEIVNSPGVEWTISETS